ncbi:MAG: 2-C-methyl-D-erythritol 4-phosphate cytidylyltransferase [Pyrinomonadaceae bacterium]
MNTAIIVAAGTGQRFSSDEPKQFVPILGKQLILHTLEIFDACSAIDHIVLVLSANGQVRFEEINRGNQFVKLTSIVLGGQTRAESVRNGLAVIGNSGAGIVVVHDGARPLVTCDEITRTLRKAEETGAACLVADVTDTIKEVKGGEIAHTVDRSVLRRALTPQAFRYDILVRAFEGARLDDSVTDECYLVEKLGVLIAAVAGSGSNIKVTRPEDVLFVESVLRSEQIAERVRNKKEVRTSK